MADKKGCKWAELKRITNVTVQWKSKCKEEKIFV